MPRRVGPKAANLTAAVLHHRQNFAVGKEADGGDSRAPTGWEKPRWGCCAITAFRGGRRRLGDARALQMVGRGCDGARVRWLCSHPVWCGAAVRACEPPQWVESPHRRHVRSSLRRSSSQGYQEQRGRGQPNEGQHVKRSIFNFFLQETAAARQTIDGNASRCHSPPKSSEPGSCT